MLAGLKFLIFFLLQILRISHRYNPDKDMIQFANGTWLNRDELQQGGFGPLTATIFSFARSLKNMACDETEFARLSAVCLISGGRLASTSFLFVDLPFIPSSRRSVCVLPFVLRELK